MSKKFAAFLVLTILSFGLGIVNAMQHEGSWTGEIVDVACYATKGAMGTSHADCGSKCVKSGLPVGLLVGDTTYILVGADHKPLNEALAPHVGHTVTVTGAKFEKPGSNVIAVKDFKMATK